MRPSLNLRRWEPDVDDAGNRAARAAPLAGVKVSEVHADQIQKVLDTMSKSGRASSSVRQLGALLGGAFRYALRTRLRTVNPMDGVTLPPAARSAIVVPTSTQIRAILDHTEDRYRMPISLAAATGARRGEICALRWSDTYLDGAHEGCQLDKVPHLHITATMQRVEGELKRMPPKTRAGSRAVPLAISAVTLLERHRAEQLRRRMKFGPGWNDTDLIVDGGHGQPTEPDTLTDSFRRACKRAKVSGVRLHDLRHAWATSMISAKQSPAAVAAFLGHSQVSFTMTTYVHADAAMAVPVAEAAEAALGDVIGS